MIVNVILILILYDNYAKSYIDVDSLKTECMLYLKQLKIRDIIF